MNTQPMSLDGNVPNNPSQDMYVLNREGLSELTKAIFTNVNTRISDRITTSMDENSDANHVPSASTVYNAVKGLSKVKSLIITSGNIEDATITPDPNTIYMVRKNAADTKGTMHIWVEGIGYISCGDEDAGSSDVNVNAIPNDIISQIVSESYAETDPGIAANSAALEE